MKDENPLNDDLVGGDQDQEKTVEDQDGYTDTERKRVILDNRQKCQETAEFVFPRVSQGVMRQEAAVRTFHEPVRNYLLSIEPLLKQSDLPLAEQAYLGQPMGVVEFPLPPKFQGLGGRIDPKQVKKRGFRLLGDPPEPDQHTIIGLKEIIERDEYTHTWEVEVNPIGGMAAKTKPRDTHTETVVKPTPKMALINAVRTADEFLQNAGVGLELGDQTTEAESDYSDIDEIDNLDSQ